MSRIDLTGATEAAARAWFDREQAGRLDAGRNNPATGTRWTFDDLRPIDQHAYRTVVLPIVQAVVDHITDRIADDQETAP